MRQCVKMDVNRLILEIKKRPALWNQKHVFYHNRDAIHSIWLELSSIMKHSKKALKTKWKGLRDTFRAEMRKEKNSSKDPHSRIKSKWIHYKQMLFLKDQMIPILSNSEDEDADHHEELDSKEENDINNHFTIVPNVIFERKKNISQRNSNKSNSDNAKCRTKSEKPIKTKSGTTSALYQQYEFLNDQDLSSSYAGSSTNNENIIIKQEPTDTVGSDNDEPIITSESLNENEVSQPVPTGHVFMNRANNTCVELSEDPLEMNRVDDNYHFLISLLPHIKKLPAQQQMLLRMQIQELVYKEVYRKNTDKNCPLPS